MGNSLTKNNSKNIMHISIMTWNIWFDSFEYVKRMESIISIIMTHKPDIVCLQEVIPEFKNILNSHKNTILAEYNCSPFSNVDTGYGVLTLTKKCYEANYNFIELPSQMRRQLLITSIKINGSNFAVGNVHFESLDNHKTRELQIQIANNELSRYTSAVLVGDFNFCSERNYDIHSTPLENLSLATYLPGYVDVWPYLHPQNHDNNISFNTPTKKNDYLGYTFDTSSNSMISYRRNRPHEIMRYDRIMLKVDTVLSSNEFSLSPSDIRLIGDQPLDSNTYSRNGGEFTGLFASDHFGLLATFDIGVNNSLSVVNQDESSLQKRKVSDEKVNENAMSQSQDETFENIDSNHITNMVCSSCRENVSVETITIIEKSATESDSLCPSCYSKTSHSSDLSSISLDKTFQTILNDMVTRKGIKLLAIDFDCTIIQVHTYGRWGGSVEALAAHVRPVFVSLIKTALLMESQGLFVSIVTFSGQMNAIRKVLSIVLKSDNLAGKVILRGNDGSWPIPLKCKDKRERKQAHIASVIDEIYQRSGGQININDNEVLLIDDDGKNVDFAIKNGHNGIIFPEISLPGVAFREAGSGVIEAKGVRVIRRIQVAHGCILCISQGSVVDFVGGKSGAIVNAANSGGLGGGGVDGAISRAGGKTLLSARRDLPLINEYGDRIPIGDARTTGPGVFGSLQVGYVIHAVGPNFSDYETLEEGDNVLRNAYRAAIREAQHDKIDFLAFSLLSAGIFRGNQTLANVLMIGLEVISQNIYQGLREVHLVGFTESELSTLDDCVSELCTQHNSHLSVGAGGEEYIRSFINEMTEFSS